MRLADLVKLDQIERNRVRARDNALKMMEWLRKTQARLDQEKTNAAAGAQAGDSKSMSALRSPRHRSFGATHVDGYAGADRG
jgi:hypothetical protein